MDDLAVVEVATDELAVGFVFFESGDGEVVGFHNGEALGGDGAEERVGVGLFSGEGGGAREGFDEGDEWVGVRGGSGV